MQKKGRHCMDFSFTEEQIAIRDTCRDFAKKKKNPMAKKIDPLAPFRMTLFAKWESWACWVCHSRKNMVARALIFSPTVWLSKKSRVATFRLASQWRPIHR